MSKTDRSLELGVGIRFCSREVMVITIMTGFPHILDVLKKNDSKFLSLLQCQASQ